MTDTSAPPARDRAPTLLSAVAPVFNEVAIVDELVEPARAHLIPGFVEAKTNAIEAGALACTISGAGPTTFALAQTRERADALLGILDESFTHAGVVGQGQVDSVGPGARVISRPVH